MKLATHRAQVTKTAPKTRLLAGLTTGHMVNDFYSMVLPPLIPVLVLWHCPGSAAALGLLGGNSSPPRSEGTSILRGNPSRDRTRSSLD